MIDCIFCGKPIKDHYIRIKQKDGCICFYDKETYEIFKGVKK